jgi:hypothetical protein
VKAMPQFSAKRPAVPIGKPAKLDFTFIPVIEVARELFGQEGCERSTDKEKHFADNAGLFVNVQKNKWYSHGHETGGDVVSLIRFATGCDFQGAVAWLGSRGYLAEGQAKTPKRITAEYDYLDKDGKDRYQVVRREPKDFRQRRRHGDDWAWGMKEGTYQRSAFGGDWYRLNGETPKPGYETVELPAVKALPYHLPELLQSGDAPVLLPGGEKDVDNLRALGFTATCNHGGEGKWWPELTPHFKGRQVFILCDNDAAGENHQATVGATLEGTASEIRVLRFPELQQGGDVSDWIERRRKDGLGDRAIKNELAQRLRDAPAWHSAPAEVSSSEEWPEPDLSVLSHQRLEAPKLPLEIFGTYWSEWIRDQGHARSCAPDYVAGGLLSSASVLIGNARRGSPWEGWEEPPVLWTNNVGNPSSGKSPGLDASRELIGAIETDSNQDYKDKLTDWDTKRRECKVRLDVWEGACKTALKDGIPILPARPQDTDEPQRPSRKRIITNDPTIEKIGRLVSENPKGLLLFRDELAGWIGALDRYGGCGSDRAFYLESYGGRPYAIDRMKDSEPIVIPALSIGIVGGIQPDRLTTLVLSGDDDGLAARFLYLWPERVPPQRPTRRPPSGAKTKLAKLYQLRVEEGGDDLSASIGTNGTGVKRVALPFEEAAAAALQDYRRQVAEAEVEASGLFLSWMGKLPGMAVRLATVLEHLYWCGDHEDGNTPPESISERATVAAIAFLDQYATPMARRCFGEAVLPQVDVDVRVLARWVVANKPETINARDLRRRARVLSAKADVARYDAAIAELEAAGWLRPNPARSGDTVGRQRKDWTVNPKLGGRT